MTAARDLAATDKLVERARRGLRASRDRRGERDAEIIRDLAVEGLQAMDVLAVELRRIPALEKQAADAQEAASGYCSDAIVNYKRWKDAEARAVRAEEALRQAGDALHEETPQTANLIIDAALAAAGADTP